MVDVGRRRRNKQAKASSRATAPTTALACNGRRISGFVTDAVRKRLNRQPRGFREWCATLIGGRKRVGGRECGRSWGHPEAGEKRGASNGRYEAPRSDESCVGMLE
eukprot:1089703-Pleurochrysis_carterae.AAC.2